MSGYDDLISSLGTRTILCSNLGFGEQGAVLSKMPKSIFVCPDVNFARNMKSQLDALGRENVLIDDFDKPYTLSKFESTQNKIDLLRAIYLIAKKDSIVISTPQILTTLIPNIDVFSKYIYSIRKNEDIDPMNLENKLVHIGYKKTESVTSPGEFARRGDVFDIFNVIDDNPIRIDFFDTLVEGIHRFDYVTFEKLGQISNIDIVPNKLCLELYDDALIKKLSQYKTEDNLFFEMLTTIDRDEDIPLEFIAPFTKSVCSFSDLNLPIIISSQIKVETAYDKLFESNIEKIQKIFKSENYKKILINSNYLIKFSQFYEKINKKIIIFENFDIENNEFYKFDKLKLNFKTINFSSYLHNLQRLQIEMSQYKDRQIYLCLSSDETLNAIKKIFTEIGLHFSTNSNDKGIILTTLKIPYNICFEDEEKLYIGSTNFAHKREFKGETKTTVKYLPKAGEYVVHNVHGIGRCEGVITVNVSGVDKEFFRLTYRGGDTLYVPYENADCLSLYMADGGVVTLNKLSGKEFATQKLKAQKSIEDMSSELLEIYAKRKAAKGFKYSEDDYLYTEFENAFEYTETPDQMQAINDVKNDMITGKVMDRLICGDVGFGKTEVAMRALFKAVENGKQVAILAPTTILSMQHCMTATSRTKDFGVKVEMLNRFKSSKEQKQIIEDVSTGKINVICGTHRLLSKDVKFHDLGLLILDEEQRFGVKAKEQIKELKNNVDVLTLSATPIPRTLNMSLMNIRDISIINSAPTNRLPVKTYVLGYNQDIIASAINDEINRGGQVLVVYNNVENIYAMANRLKEAVDNPNASFDVAHGQMSEIALENAVKHLYEGVTNVFVSTTLIENGIDLPRANTLIVIESDRLGLSQMYQLRGRVGRSGDQAYAYFTYNKDKTLTEDAANRLQAIAENTDLGSGFKIAMRDLQIRGAGELLGKIQHGHMIKIGYEMYSKLLNDTLRKLKGEKVEVERDIKIDIAIQSKIPYSFVEDESERLKIVAKISNVTSKDSARAVLNELLSQYGKLPHEIYTLVNIALLKSLAVKAAVKQLVLTKNNMYITYYQDVDLNALLKKVARFTHFKFQNGALPTIALNTEFFSVQTAMNYCIEFLGL